MIVSHKSFSIMICLASGISVPTLASENEAKELTELSLRELLEVKVFAQKRLEKLQDVPISVNVIQQRTISRSGLSRLNDISTVSTSLGFNHRISFSKSDFTSRGIGTLVFGIGVEPSVATMVDDVVMARGGAGQGELFDVERIEVLNGPQGTLFGKNTSAGLIHVITKAASFDELENSMSTTLTEDNEYKLSVSSSGPISPKLAYRLNFTGRHYGGNVINLYNEDKLNGFDGFGARGKLDWRVTDNINILFSVDYSYQDTTNGVRVLRQDSENIITDPRAIGIDAPSGTAGQLTGIIGSPNNNLVNLNRNPELYGTAYGGSIKVIASLPNHEFTSISAVRHWAQENDRDNDQTQYDFSHNQLENHSVNWMSHEMRLASDTDKPWDYMLGVYYFKSKIQAHDGDDRTFSNAPYLVEFNLADNQVSAENKAVFGRVNIDVSNKATVFAGLRWLHDKTKATLHRMGYQQNNTFLSDGAILSTKDIGPLTNDASHSKVIGRIGARYNYSDSIMGYVTYSEGFKGAAFNTSFKFDPVIFMENEPAAPEQSKSLEAGIRTQGKAMRFNLTGFSTKVYGLHVTLRDLVLNQNRLGAIPKISSRGIEMNLTAFPSDSLQLDWHLTYIDAQYDDFDNANCYAHQSVENGCVEINGNKLQHLTGATLFGSPKWKSHFKAVYQKKYGDYTGFVQAKARIQSTVIFDPAGNPATKQDGYGIVDLSIGAHNDDFQIRFYVNNVFNKQYISGVSNNGNAGGDIINQLLPRNFYRYAGISIIKNF